jgi:predicted transcriptional regulator
MFGTSLSRRERQIMDVIYRQGRATATAVLEALPDPPSYSAVRALLRILEAKGHLRHEKEGRSYVYLSTEPRQMAAQSALAQVVHTFFGGSVEETVATLLTDRDTRLSDEELDRLSRLIEQAREEGR